MQNSIENFFHKVDSRLFKPFLLLGLLMGIFLGSLRVSASQSDEQPNHQENFLIALVENSEDETSPLLALWLAATSIESGEVSWMPIYPQVPEKDIEATFGAPDPVLINPQDMQSFKNISLLREEAIWWDEVIVLDSLALTQIMELMPTQDNNLAISQKTLYEQVNMIRHICEESNQFDNPESLNQILAMMGQPARIKSTLTSFDIISYWDILSSKQFELTCSHPWAD